MICLGAMALVPTVMSPVPAGLANDVRPLASASLAAGYHGRPPDHAYTTPAEAVTTPANAVTTPAVTPATPADAVTTPADAVTTPAVTTNSPAPAVTARPGTFLARLEAQAGDCDLRVPRNPLSARGLATPYQLSNGPNTAGCTMANEANLGAFVQATIFDPATGTVSVYDPLVITAGTMPAEPPVLPALPRRAVVTIAAGFNGNIDFLTGPGARFFTQGLPGSPFGQEAWANAPAFYAAAERRVAVPPLGVAGDGMTCPTVRDFSLVDQDPDDNVTSHYLLTAGGLTAQDNAANTAALPGATIAQNGSDNNLLATFVDPALGCTPFTAPDLANPGAMTSSQQLNELQAAARQGPPVALVEPGDPMTTIGSDDDIIAGDFPQAGNLSAFKTDLYRINVGQPFISFFSSGQAGLVAVTQQWCQDIQTIGVTRLALDAGRETGPSPVATMTLAQFLAARFAASVALVNCKLFNPGSNVTVVPGSAPASTPAPSMTTTAPASTPATYTYTPRAAS